MATTHKIEISIWQKEGNTIGIALRKQKGITGISTVNDNDISKRGNPHLYNQLKQILLNEEKWVE